MSQQISVSYTSHTHRNALLQISIIKLESSLREMAQIHSELLAWNSGNDSIGNCLEIKDSIGNFLEIKK